MIQLCCAASFAQQGAALHAQYAVGLPSPAFSRSIQRNYMTRDTAAPRNRWMHPGHALVCMTDTALAYDPSAPCY